MEKPLTAASSLVDLAAFALQASQSLSQTIESFQSDKRNVPELQYDLESLNRILEALRQVAAENEAEFSALKPPLLQCGKICKEFTGGISKRMTHCNWKETNFWDGQVVTWRTTLAAYKVVISIALGGATFREAAVAIDDLVDYKRLIAEAMPGLQKHLKIVNGGDIDEMSNIRDETKSLEQCLTICDKVSEFIDSRLRLSREHSTDEKQPSSPGPRNVNNAVTVTKEMLVEFQIRLSGFSTILGSPQIGSKKTPQASPWQEAEQMREDNAELNDMGEDSDRDASDPAETARKNTFEDIASADDSHQLVVSTNGDLISARHIVTGTMSVQWLGQMSDGSLQKLSSDHRSRADEKKPQAQTEQDRFYQFGVGRNLRGGQAERGTGCRR